MKRRYGCWAGNPKGAAEDSACCIETVGWGDRGAVGRQCQRPRGHGPGGLYCRQHDPAAKEARDKKSKARWDAEFALADRKAACVNACLGLTDDELESLTDGGVKKLLSKELRP